MDQGGSIVVVDPEFRKNVIPVIFQGRTEARAPIKSRVTIETKAGEILATLEGFILKEEVITETHFGIDAGIRPPPPPCTENDFRRADPLGRIRIPVLTPSEDFKIVKDKIV